MFLRAAVVALMMVPAEPIAGRQAHQHADADKLGTVNFQNSCAPEVQPTLTRAVALLHSFEFSRAIDAFTETAVKDPSCAIAYWGVAMSRWGNPFSIAIKPPAQLLPGRTAIERGRMVGAKSERERDYVAAVAALYDNFERVDQRTRMLAYRDAMGRAAAKYPDDTETSAFYALALAAAADPADKTYVDQLKAGAILEKLWEALPDHPGLAHYIIHSYDVPALASRALAAARRYAKIAPSAPHALHMPSHTFTRLGYWQDSIGTNVLSAAAARKEGQLGEELHALDYQVYAYLQTGQDRAAKRVVDSLPQIAPRFDPNLVAGAAPGSAGVFAVAAIPARYAMERGAWAAAAKLDVHASRFPFADAMTWFARAVGSARTKDVAAARAAIDELQKLTDSLTQAGERYWADQVAIQRLDATAWLALAEAKPDEALSTMRTAAEREDATEKSAITPGPLAPARELLGEMLLQLKQPKPALAEFEATLAREPNRFRALSGAATAALQAGDRARAHKYAQQLIKICARADVPARADLTAARGIAMRTSK
ncbi:MAG: hypothetical protein DMF85_10080 [Acidobacteria bacterium]|nr:MAG: hypothetical protein DMF85_10080 [Acidobacteriota bacterium]